MNEQSIREEAEKLPGDLKKPLHIKPSLYAMYFEGLKKIAAEHGYNLCIHGSMSRDFDLVAFAWSENVKPHFEMLDSFREFLGGQFNSVSNEGGINKRLDRNGSYKYIINVLRRTPFTGEKDKEFYLDINVFPPLFEYSKEIEELKEKLKHATATSIVQFQMAQSYKEEIEALKQELATMYDLNREGWGKVEVYEKLKDELSQENSALKVEEERLKGLVREGFILLQREWKKTDDRILSDWNQFKQQNNL